MPDDANSGVGSLDYGAELYGEQLNAVFARSKAVWRSTYERFRDLALEELPEFSEAFPQVGILWRHRFNFAGFRVTKAALLVDFYSNELHQERCPVQVLHASRNRYVHVVALTRVGQFPELLDWIMESYELKYR